MASVPFGLQKGTVPGGPPTRISDLGRDVHQFNDCGRTPSPVLTIVHQRRYGIGDDVTWLPFNRSSVVWACRATASAIPNMGNDVLGANI